MAPLKEGEAASLQEALHKSLGLATQPQEVNSALLMYAWRIIDVCLTSIDLLESAAVMHSSNFIASRRWLK